jgi:LPS export ABC transporter protein LptC
MVMRAPNVKILRRGLVGLIIVVAAFVALNILRNFNFHEQPKPGLLGLQVTRSAEGVEYSDNKNGVARFKVRAQRVVETTQGKNLLMGIEAYGFNPDGSVRNEIRSQKAIYDTDGKTIDFSGKVKVFLGKGVEIRTDSLHYDLNADVGTSPDRLQFYSQSANGKARGIRFDQKTQSLELGSEAEFNIDQKSTEPGNSNDVGSMHASSERAHSSGETHKIVFQGKARIESKNYGLISGDTIEVSLTPDQRHVTSLVSAGNAAYRSQDGAETRNLSGNQMVFGIGESNALEKISVLGDAAFVSDSPAEEEHLRGGEIDLEFDAGKGAIKQVQGRRGVQFRMKRGAEQTLISGEQLSAQFAPETRSLTNIHVAQNAKLSAEGAKDTANNNLQSDDLRVSFRRMNERAAIEKIRAEGSVRWRSVPPGNTTAQNREAARSLEASLLELENAAEGDYLESGRASGKVIISESSIDKPVQPQMRRLSADSTRFRFFPKDGQLKELNAEGHVQTAFEKKGKGPGGSMAVDNFRTESDKLTAIFVLNDGRSVVQSATQWGNFSYRDDARSATAGRCDYEAEKEVMLLTESPRISDQSSATSGERVEYDRKRKILSAHANVQSKIGTQKDGGLFFGSSAAASSSQAIIMADEMRYETDTGRFHYSGNVRLLSENQQLRAQILDISSGGERIEAQGEVWHLIKESSPAGKSQSSSSPQKSPITIQSKRMQYLKTRNELNYAENVTLTSTDVKMSSATLEAELDKDGMIQNATAGGKVRIVHQGGRESKSETAHWSLETGIFIIEGNPAEIFDPVRGRSSARQLTYFKASDRILLGKQ